MEFTEGCRLLNDALFYFRNGKYKPLLLIINGLCPYQETEPSKDPESDIKEAIYLHSALEIKDTPEIRAKFCNLLNGVRAELLARMNLNPPV